ncbi:ribosomal protein L1p/L10e family-domain-containing protein [Peziza echinospora]|nr:ribosomal protein L1p/L10e family-domain-containing protein [Peziza echinospora]
MAPVVKKAKKQAAPAAPAAPAPVAPAPVAAAVAVAAPATTAVAASPKKPTGPAVAEPSPIDQEQVLKASRALAKYIASVKANPSIDSGKPNLLGDDDETVSGSHGIYGCESIWLVITTKKFLSDKKQLMPVRIAVPNPLLSAANTSALLIVKDPQRAYKDLLLPRSPVVQKVVGLSKLRSKYKTFESRRQLRDSYDLILADDRVVTSLRNTIGSSFLKSNSKVPIPVKISGKDASSTPSEGTLDNQIQKAVEAVYVHIPAASSVNVRAALERHTPEQVVENIVKITQAAIGQKKVVKGGWNSVRSIYIKAGDSVALPVYVADKLFDTVKDVVTVEEREDSKKAAEEKKKQRAEKQKEKRALKGLKGVAVDGDKKKRKAEEDLPKEAATPKVDVVADAATAAVSELTLEKAKKRKVVVEKKDAPVVPAAAAEKKEKSKKSKKP